MKLEQAIAYAIEHEGIEVITEIRFVNYLNDLQAFDTPAIRRIISTMVTDGYFAKLKPALREENYELQFSDVAAHLVKIEGFQEDLVKFVLDCLLCAVHKTVNVPVAPATETFSEQSNINSARKSSAFKSNDLPFTVVKNGKNFLVDFNGKSYELNNSQYDAIMRKRSIPADRLEVWLDNYAEENDD